MGLLEVKSQSAMICLNFNQFSGDLGGGRLGAVRKSKLKVKFQFLGVGECSGSQNSKCQDLPKFKQGVVRNLSTNFTLLLSGSLWITDSLSHTYVETNYW